ncbi:MAG TPA: hypothetical protein VML35_08735, partial [Gaiellaceae bacterium]|nr:hypothetical protein [Gaiellaceae bacterium]
MRLASRRALVGAAGLAVLLGQLTAVALFAREVGVPEGERLAAALSVGVAVPLALAGVYVLGAALAGPAFGLWAAAVWAFAPFAAVPLFDPRYRETYVEGFLPHAFGLSGGAALPAAAVLLVSAALTAVAVPRGSVALTVAAGAGLVAAAALAPAAALAAPAP